MTVSSKRQTRNPPSLPAFTLGAVLGLDCLPAAADAGQHNGQAFYTLDPKHVIALDGGDALVILANGQSLLVSQGQFGRDAQGNFVITDAALADDMVQRFGGRPSYSADNVEPGGVALHAEPPEGYQPGTAAAGELDGSSLRMQAPLAGAVGAGGLSAAAFVPMAAIPVAAVSLNEPGGALDSPGDPQPDPGDPQPDPADPQPDPGNPQPDPGGPQELSGFIIKGEPVLFGGPPSALGDVNDDNINDYMIQSGDNIYVLLGRTGSYEARLDLSMLDDNEGFQINSSLQSSGVFNSLSSAGDINGDGISDIVIGKPFSDGLTGRAYVVYGKTDDDRQRDTAYDGGVLDLGALTSHNGITIESSSSIGGAILGLSVASAGDFNGDDVSDAIITVQGGNRTDGNYVIFGNRNGLGDSFVDDSGLDGQRGFLIDFSRDITGPYAAGVGDINDDGFDDVIVTRGSQLNVVFGTSDEARLKDPNFNADKDQPPGDSFDLARVDGSNGFVISGYLNVTQFKGRPVSPAGDFNGDNIPDIVVSAPKHSVPDGDQKIGATFLIYGRATDFGPRVNLKDDIVGGDGSAGIVIYGANPRDQSGWYVAGGGDINKDGYDDIIISTKPVGADGGDTGAAKSYVVFGKKTGYGPSLNLSSIETGDGSDGFMIKGREGETYKNFSASIAGDINADGFDDIIVGASETGEHYIVFGMARFDPVVDLASLPGLA